MDERLLGPSTLFPPAQRHWVFQCDPDTWDVFAWWEDQEHDIRHWRVRNTPDRIQPGDNAVLWIAGKAAGVYAVGKVTTVPSIVEKPAPGERSYWRVRPDKDYLACGLEFDRYLFGAPIRKADLKADPDFADALIITIPGGGVPQALTDRQWGALERHLSRNPSVVTALNSAAPVVTERSLNEVVETTTVTTPADESVRHHREAELVKAYERYLGRPLVILSVTLPTRERLVTDAYDSHQRRGDLSRRRRLPVDRISGWLSASCSTTRGSYRPRHSSPYSYQTDHRTTS